MSAEHEQSAGAKAPADRVLSPRWRDRRDHPIYQVTLWPHQSMTPLGLKTVLSITAVGLLIPLLGSIGTLVFWGLLPFMVLAFWGLVHAIQRNVRDRRIRENLWIWRDEMRVERHEPDGRALRWQAVPAEVRMRVHNDAQIEEYLTLEGAGREIELGAFLTPEERIELSDEIERALGRAIRG